MAAVNGRHESRRRHPVGHRLGGRTRRGLADHQPPLRDAVFSRRYRGEPFPIKYEQGVAKRITDATVTPVDAYLPTEDGEPPLHAPQRRLAGVPGRRHGDQHDARLGGNSRYFLRYMDPHNERSFAPATKRLGPGGPHVGGAEHTTGTCCTHVFGPSSHDLGTSASMNCSKA